MRTKRISFIYRSFLNFWLMVVLPISVIITVITKLYYEGGVHLAPLKDVDTWLSVILYQAFIGFFLYIWVFIPKVKKYKNGENKNIHR